MTAKFQEIAQENENFMEKKNPYKSSSTIPLSISLIRRYEPLLSVSLVGNKNCYIKFYQAPSEMTALKMIAEDFESARVCILNFADRKIPGGLYLQGAQTQEESLCRAMPGLYRSLALSNAYPYQSYETILWTPRTWIHRGEKQSWLSQPIAVSIISAAAPNLCEGEEFKEAEFLPLLESILICPYLFDDCNILILGAFGCGAFRNDPVRVAHCFGLAIQKYGHLYSKIIFAIPERPKLDVFVEEFSKILQKITVQ